MTFAAPVANLTSANFETTGTGNIWTRIITGVSGAGTTHTVTVYTSLAPGPSTGTGTGTVGLNLVNATSLVPGLTTPLPFVGEVYTLDNAAPTAVLSSAAGSATSTAPIPFTVTFSEPVAGFAASGLSVSNGIITSAITAVGAAYSFGVAPTANGPVTVSLAANATQDAAGNGSLAAPPLSVVYTQLMAPAPTPTLTTLSPAAGPMGTSVTISGTNLGGTMAVSFNGTAASSFVVNSATSLTAIVVPGTTTGPVTVTTPGGSATSSASFVVRVAPTTVAESYSTPADVTLTGNVLTNDIGTNPRAILLLYPTHGTLVLNPDGTFTYRANAGYTGPDSFLYYACDPSQPLLCGNPVTVNITVTPRRVAPVTVADAYTTPQGVLLTGNVLTNDLGTNPRAILIIRPTRGVLVLNPNGSFSYQPNAGFVGTDSFIYYACDPAEPLLCGNPVTVSITVLPAGSTARGAAPATGAPAAKPAGGAAGGATVALELTLAGHPNPFGDELQLSFALPIAQAYTLALYDAQGRLVRQLASGQVEAGQAQELAMPTQGYAAGLYLVRLSTDSGTRQLKLLKQ